MAFCSGQDGTEGGEVVPLHPARASGATYEAYAGRDEALTRTDPAVAKVLRSSSGFGVAVTTLCLPPSPSAPGCHPSPHHPASSERTGTVAQAIRPDEAATPTMFVTPPGSACCQLPAWLPLPASASLSTTCYYLLSLLVCV